MGSESNLRSDTFLQLSGERFHNILIEQARQILNRGRETLGLSWSNPWDNVYATEGIPEDLRNPYFNFDYILTRIIKSEARNVIDVAMGPGRHAIAMAEKGLEVYGFDLSKIALRLAQQELERKKIDCHLQLGDMFGKYNYPDNFFDAGVAIQAIYHGYPPHMKAALLEIHRVLRPGAVFGFTVSMDCERAMQGADRKVFKKVDDYPNTFIPQSGREKGLPHYYPDEAELEAMLRPDFNNIELHTDLDHLYRLIICVNN